MNGVCVTFKGVIDLQRLDGTAYLEHDTAQAKVLFIRIKIKPKVIGTHYMGKLRVC